MTRRFVTLDVFTTQPHAGNPLAVVLDGEGLDTAAMQAITREFNLSETVFVFPPENPGHRAAIRIFTPGAELPFAGHPTVGTAVWLALSDEAEGRPTDLLVLEEELLFPANTQVAVFVSMDVGKLFELESVQVKLDDKVVTNFLYTPLQVQAFHRGGVQRVYLGNLRTGPHTLVAFFTGRGPHERDYKRGTTLKFDKGTDPKYIELQIKDSTGKIQPEFEVKVWQ